ncbi:hypothetical protein [Ferviditalea candida]|uniref:Uncharacterized protein n=1 Tax=Ferviditalea candida TaxID=3108399 RepID=A0ABU5ZGY6_9BACL|nr:hypothetical protein [Paenibacillaceae bacterium T2]
MISSADNLLKNPSFETDTTPADNWPDHWTQYVEPGKTASFAWSSTSRFAQKAVSISNPTG